MNGNIEKAKELLRSIGKNPEVPLEEMEIEEMSDRVLLTQLLEIVDPSLFEVFADEVDALCDVTEKVGDNARWDEAKVTFLTTAWNLAMDQGLVYTEHRDRTGHDQFELFIKTIEALTTDEIAG